MENRKSIKIIAAAFLMLGLFIFSNSAFAYDEETHGFLTEEIVKFYNQHFKNKNEILSLSKDYLVDGSRLEDNMPRYSNHFYDPIHNRGLADGIYKGMASKLWAQDSGAQQRIIYKLFPQTVASLLTASQLDKIKPVFKGEDFTWQRAIDLYAQGDTEAAMFALGHILHLIEDAAVPDHTRNDAHPPFDHGGSPYENWTKQFNLKNPDKTLTNRLVNKKPIILNNLNDYFNGMANYSNNNFYSRDSVKNYELPKPDYFERVGDYIYGFRTDKENGDYYLAAFIKSGDFEYVNGSTEETILLKEKIGELRIVPNYWHRLSTKAVQYGAGVVDLFFKEAEKAKVAYKLEKARRPYLGTLVDGFRKIFGSSSNIETSDVQNLGTSEVQNAVGKGKLIAVVPLDQPKREEPQKPEPIPIEIIPLQLQSSNPIVVPGPEFKICSFNTSQSPSRQGALINEVAWMGTVVDPNNEWIELKNISGGLADISGWQLVDMAEQIKVVFDEDTRLGAGQFYLLERTDDNSVPQIPADKIYKGSLANAGEKLRLYDANCNLIDEVVAGPDWPAGDDIYRKTMERAADLSWRTSSEVGGTPKAENSAGTVPVNNAGGGTTQSPRNQDIPLAPEAPRNDSSASPPPSPEVTAIKANILISEIQAGTEAGGAADEFVELYNAGDQEVDLTGWSLKKKTSTGTEANLVSAPAFAGKIKSKSFFLIAHKDYGTTSPATMKKPDLIYSSNSNNLAYTNNSAVLYDKDGKAVDEAQWIEILKGQSLERRALQGSVCVSAQGSGEFLGNGCDNNYDHDNDNNTTDFEFRMTPRPQNSADLPEPRASAAIPNFQISYSPEKPGLSLTWEAAAGVSEYSLLEIASASPRNDLLAGSEQAVIASSSEAILLATTTETGYELSIKEIGRDYDFYISAKDSDGFEYSASSTINVPSFLKSLALYDSAIGLEWERYPFIPSLTEITGEASSSDQGQFKNWHMMRFYKNRDAATTTVYGESSTGWGFRSSDGLAVTFPNCQGSETAGAFSLVLPDTEESCTQAETTIRQLSVQWTALEDPRLILDLGPQEIAMTDQDYITVAFYSYDPAAPDNAQRLVATDKTKYLYQGERPANQPPTPPNNFTAEYNYADREIILTWEASQDPDGPDSKIFYELNYLEDLWQKISSPKRIPAQVGDAFIFKLRAVDDKGLVSESAVKEYVVPLPLYISEVLFSQDDGGNFISFTLNDTNTFNNPAYSRYVMVWFNEDPVDPNVQNRNTGIYPNWAAPPSSEATAGKGGGCPAMGYVGDGQPEENGGTGFDHYVMPEFNVADPRPPVYDRAQAPYHYKVYSTDSCPNGGFINGRDLSDEMSKEDFITVGLWFYNSPNGFISKEESVNYPERHYFQP